MWVMVPSLSALRAPRPKSVDMDTISIAFSGVQMTALFELYLRWLDNPESRCGWDGSSWAPGPG